MTRQGKNFEECKQTSKIKRKQFSRQLNLSKVTNIQSTHRILTIHVNHKNLSLTPRYKNIGEK